MRSFAGVLPTRWRYDGKKAVSKALDACVEPIIEVKKLIAENPDLEDEKIADLYNASGKLPALGAPVVTFYKKEAQ